MNKKVILIILDGWGISPDPKVSAIAQAQTPFIDSLYKKYPHAQLLTHGLNVGLPEGQMGNSEVGHTNLGAGRIVYQDLVKINRVVENDSLAGEKALTDAFAYAKEKGKAVHFLGLVSDGGVHSHINHLKGLLDAAYHFGLKDLFIHAFTDGRDVDPKSGKGFIADIQAYGAVRNARLASITGRYYAMDRDKRWERIKLAYDALTKGDGILSSNAAQAIQNSYDAGVTDEFIKPIILKTQDNQPVATLKEGDVALFFNYRTDRGRQLTQALTQQDFPDYNMKRLNLYFVTLTNYDDSFRNIHVVYDKDNLTDTLGEVLTKAGKKQIRIAETEKYPHVTFFFNGGREEPFEGEKRILCPSPKVATYDLKPEMSAYDIRDAIIPELKKGEADFVCLNFANPDMVGHTGSMPAAIKACETVDACLKDVITAAIGNSYSAIILADHGNCDTMLNPDGSPNTAHTTNPVPIIVVDEEVKNVRNGILSDVAPTILELMGIKQPLAMNRKPLI